MDLRDEHLARRDAELAAALADVIADRRLGNLDTVLVDQPPPDPLGRVALRGASRSAINHSSISSRYAPSLGAGLDDGARLGGGTGDANACRTARR